MDACANRRGTIRRTLKKGAPILFRNSPVSVYIIQLKKAIDKSDEAEIPWDASVSN